MAWHSSTDTWPGGGDDAPTTIVRAPAAAARAARRTRSWPAWVLPTLAFVCGALVSAAVFTIGWRQQTQQNSAAQAALAAATARSHKLASNLSAARADAAREKQLATQANATLQAARASSATIAAQAGAVQSNATAVSSNAAATATAAGKISTELKTLITYLTTTPPNELDAGYVDSQAAYLARQVDTLQSEGGATSSAAATFDAAIRRLTGLASALAKR
jgi:hypothetical protein